MLKHTRSMPTTPDECRERFLSLYAGELRNPAETGEYFVLLRVAGREPVPCDPHSEDWLEPRGNVPSLVVIVSLKDTRSGGKPMCISHLENFVRTNGLRLTGASALEAWHGGRGYEKWHTGWSEMWALFAEPDVFTEANFPEWVE